MSGQDLRAPARHGPLSRPLIDRTLPLLAERYAWLPDRMRDASGSVVRTRIMGRPALALRGPEAVRFFYDAGASCPGTAPAAARTTASARTTFPCPPRTCCSPKSTGPAEWRPLRQRACHSAGVPAGAHAPCAWWVCRHWYVTPSRVTTAPVS
ncbi:hypothetical protein GCM10019016_115350 [Streptomyces prasinosporus]|uniref:Uncharacterized protein n=1 Tax=Streptomyces prasinosporus TaxID=68256 RepID=A0ABP6U9X1_9ACTN|nr:hypothetical protein GCM10010332_27330 [Streptomyces albogriseolus]